MTTFDKFLGLNNVQPAEQLKAGELTLASNVDIDLALKPRRRKGYTLPSATVHKNVWQADGFKLATRGAGGDLVNVDTNTVLHAALGHTRVWYVNLPDGRTAYSNGTACGVVSASARTTWGVPIPASVGSAANTTGSLAAGDYQWSVTHVRASDGRESGPAYSAGAVTVANGGIAFSSLPVLAGHSTRVYLTSHFGGERYFAGTAVAGALTYTGPNHLLQLRCPTEFMRPAPAGKLLAFWRGRALVAVGPVLYASRPHQHELFDMRRDFKQFPADITLVQPVEGGIFVGTGEELGFMAGSQFDALSYSRRVAGAVALGSGVTVPGKKLRIGQGVEQGDCMLCLAAGVITAGLPSGAVVALTDGRYTSAATEVWATFREIDGIPQYLAAVQ